MTTRDRANRAAVNLLGVMSGNRGECFAADVRQAVDLIIDAAKEEIAAEQAKRISWVVQKATRSTPYAGAPGCWYVCHPNANYYLHSDGEWRLGVANPADLNDYSTGFFPSRADAQSALDAAIAAGNLPPRSEG